MNTNDVVAELKRSKDLVFLLAANGDEGRIYGHGPDFATALNAAISGYHGSQLACPYGGEPVDDERTLQAVNSLVVDLKRSGVPFVLAWYVPSDAVARLDCSGDINVREELIDCLTGELQDAFTF